MLFLSTRIFSLLILAITTTLAKSLAASLPYSTSIYTWPLTSDTPTLLAEISYDPKTLTTSLDSYNAPKRSSVETNDDGTNETLLRIGLYNKDTKEWTGTLTSLSSLPASSSPSSDQSAKNTTLTLHLNPTNPTEVYHVSLSPSASSSALSSKNADDPLQVSLVSPTAGPTPQLSKPVAPRKAGDGQGEEGEEEEKTLFQRYWWVFLLGAFLILSGSGEGK